MRWILAGLLASRIVSAQGVNFYSEAKEAALGQALAGEALRRTPRLDDAPLADYVRGLAGRIAPFTQARFEARIEVTRDTAGREVTALPGGYLFVPLGAIAAAESEAAFAGLLTHGLAHVAARHATRDATRAQIAGLAAVPLLFMPHGDHGWIVPRGFAVFQRRAELEADTAAAEALGQAGYDPGEYAALLEQTAGAARQDTAARLDAVRRAPSPGIPFETGEFPVMRERAASIVRTLTPRREPPSLRRR